MTHDYRSANQSTDAWPGARPDAAPRSIGFHELRQACEISALREDLERIVRGTESLRDGIEEAVDEVRNRFAALTAEELADSTKMAPLLEFAVASLLEIREQARALNTSNGAVPDDERPSWSAPARTAPVPAAPSFLKPPAPNPSLTPPPAPASLAPPAAWTPSAPASLPTAPRPAAPPAAAPAPSMSWLNSAKAPPERGPAPRGASPSAPGKGVDWLGPARS
ncbi:hypothetical protein [Azospirillum sp. SYSU D00513]|uniref:hypothetical protein n=1 Tax=Azospirillum sp. SYSU D00513 TaxID=2812561 RepID=UPI001A96186C|nr:hypothetical protein [Azospirillum sp. SYSU D00513]